MSVYTAVGCQELAAWLESFAVGDLVDFAGIAAGVDNSNYFVTTTGGRWVLTLFERLAVAELDSYLAFMAHLAARGFPCPRPRPAAGGALWRPLAGKPAALMSRLEGSSIEEPDAGHCRAIGAALAQLHLQAADFSGPLPNRRGSEWHRQTAGRLLPVVSPEVAALLADELAFLDHQDFASLPRGIVHADLFRDNALWRDDGSLSGVLDFYFAAENYLLFDLAVAANDWCPDDEERLAALLAGYGALRPLTPAETAAWPAARRAAALRFWLSRLEDSHHPRPGEVVTVKDPGHFGRMLERLRLAAGGRGG